jgi:transcriptional regulator with XRE-family HTH domain
MQAQKQPETLEQKVRDRCHKLGISQTELASRIGITPQALYSLIKSSNPKMETLKRLAQGLGCTIKALLP